MFRLILILLAIITYPVWQPVAIKLWHIISENITISDIIQFIFDCFNQILAFTKKIINILK